MDEYNPEREVIGLDMYDLEDHILLSPSYHEPVAPELAVSFPFWVVHNGRNGGLLPPVQQILDYERSA